MSYYVKLDPPLLPVAKSPSSGNYCGDRGEQFVCTRRVGHEGQHWGQTEEAGPVLAVWVNGD